MTARHEPAQSRPRPIDRSFRSSSGCYSGTSRGGHQTAPASGPRRATQGPAHNNGIGPTTVNKSHEAPSGGQVRGCLSVAQGLKTQDESIEHLLTEQRGKRSLMCSGEGVQPRELRPSERGEVH